MNHSGVFVCRCSNAETSLYNYFIFLQSVMYAVGIPNRLIQIYKNDGICCDVWYHGYLLKSSLWDSVSHFAF